METTTRTSERCLSPETLAAWQRSLAKEAEQQMLVSVEQHFQTSQETKEFFSQLTETLKEYPVLLPIFAGGFALVTNKLGVFEMVKPACQEVSKWIKSHPTKAICVTTAAIAAGLTAYKNKENVETAVNNLIPLLKIWTKDLRLPQNLMTVEATTALLSATSLVSGSLALLDTPEVVEAQPSFKRGPYTVTTMFPGKDTCTAICHDYLDLEMVTFENKKDFNNATAALETREEYENLFKTKTNGSKLDETSFFLKDDYSNVYHVGTYDMNPGELRKVVKKNDSRVWLIHLIAVKVRMK